MIAVTFCILRRTFLRPKPYDFLFSPAILPLKKREVFMHVVRLALGLAISLLGGCGLPQEVPCFSIQARLVEASTDDWNLRLIQSSERPKSAGGALVVVAVVDTGVDENHPLLRGKLLPLLDRVGEDRYSFGGKSFDYTGTDGNGHGTHVAGIVGSIVSKSGVMILPVKSIPNSGVGDDRAIASGLRSAVDWRDPNVPERRVRVINLSVGGKTRSRDLQEAIDYALSHDVLLVVSAGNDGVGVSYRPLLRGWWRWPRPTGATSYPPIPITGRSSPWPLRGATTTIPSNRPGPHT
jgi:subtilisin family serine protease